MLRSPTFLVGAQQQRGILNTFQRRDQQLSEEYQKNKPLCFSSRAYQKTHPGKASQGHRDADATLASPMLLGVADGVSQIEDFGVDASELPRELLRCCELLAAQQLIPGVPVDPEDTYRGPVSLMRKAFEGTGSQGSTTAILAVLDNSTRIHGKLHPMVAVITVGDCELLMLRRFPSQRYALSACFHTEMQRIDGHAQTPLQLARVDHRIDPEFTEEITIEVIERGSAVHCVSAYEGDIVVMGSDGVFDNLFLDELVDLCNSVLPPKPGKFSPTHPTLLSQLAQRIVQEAHAKSRPRAGGHYPDAPIGKGGKMDDTSVVVGEVIEWTDQHIETWVREARIRKPQPPTWDSAFLTCGSACTADDEDSGEEYDDSMMPAYRSRGASFEHYSVSRASTAGSRGERRSGRGDGDPDGTCSVS